MQHGHAYKRTVACNILYVIYRIFNKKVCYRKQIARQHSCYQKFLPGQERGRSCKTFAHAEFDQYAKLGCCFSYCV